MMGAMAFLGNPYVALIIGCVLGVALSFLLRRKRKEKLAIKNCSVSYDRNKWNVLEHRAQLELIKHAKLYTVKLMNKEEYRYFAAIEKKLTQDFPAYRIMAQVNVGEFVRTKKQFNSKKAYGAYNSKRVDFLIIDPYGNPTIAIEYHGTGHYQGNAAHRDTVKRMVLERVGVPLIEVYAIEDTQEVANRIAQTLQDKIQRNR